VVDGKSVETFDGVLYKAPISNCYSVLAKDCTNEEQPQFAVLMKNVDPEGQEKKIKVVTPDQTIECQPKPTASNGGKQIRCKINGKSVNPGEEENSAEQSGVVEYNEKQNDVTINVQGVSVRFGCWCALCRCQKVWLKISNEYKNGQCGLCGHYDDQPDNEWRMSNNELTNDLSQFHQSFSWQNNDDCTSDDQKNFYSKKEKFAPIYDSFDEDDQQMDEQEREWQSGAYDDSEENQWGFGKQSSRSKKRQQQQQQQRRAGRNSQDETQEPVKQTKVIEYNHKICFSVEPVKQCPEGTAPASNNNNNNDDEDDDQSTDKKTQFACLSRSSIDARRLQRQARRGVIIDIPDQAPSFIENVKQPLRCVQY